MVRLLELDQMACDTIESEAEAFQWLRNHHPQLDGDSPLEIAKAGYCPSQPHAPVDLGPGQLQGQPAKYQGRVALPRGQVSPG